MYADDAGTVAETVDSVLLLGDRFRHVQVHRQQYDVEDVLRHAELSGAGGATDGGVGVVHQGCGLLESWSYLVHLVDCHPQHSVSAQVEITTESTKLKCGQTSNESRRLQNYWKKP